MSATRASSIRSLKYLSSHGRQLCVRRLHMTGPAEYASPLLASSDRPKVNIPNDVPALRAECARRNLPTAGSLTELADRLTTDLHARGFSTAFDKDSKRPTPSSAVDAAPAQPTRHFNTSRALKAVNDSSTIDFAFLPDLDAFAVDGPSAFPVRVPLLPHVNFSSARAQMLDTETPEPAPMRPIISTVSADITYFHPSSALSDVTDNSSIDFHGISESSLKPRVPASNAEGTGFKQFWSGLLDDVLGPKTMSSAR